MEVSRESGEVSRESVEVRRKSVEVSRESVEVSRESVEVGRKLVEVSRESEDVSRESVEVNRESVVAKETRNKLKIIIFTPAHFLNFDLTATFENLKQPIATSGNLWQLLKLLVFSGNLL